MAIGERIKSLRKRRGLTLTQLAKRSRISKAYLSQLESGHSSNPSAEVVAKICTVLGCSMEAVLINSNVELIVPPRTVVPRSLVALAREDDLEEEDVTMLSRITYRGLRPTTVEGWRNILQTIRRSVENH